MNKRVIAALTAVLLAIVGIFFLVNYAKDANDRAFEGAKLQTVLQVVEPIRANTKAEDLDSEVKAVELPTTAIAKGAIKDLSEVAKLSTTTDMEPGELLLLSRFAEGGAADSGKASSKVPEGLQELTVPFAVARALGGTLKVGDRVGVVASYQVSGDGITRIVQNRVLVIRVTDGGPVEEGQTGASQLVTFAVSARDAGKIVNALEFGKVYLTRQNDATENGSGGSISRNDVTS